MITAKEINQLPLDECTYTLATLVTDHKQYQRLCESFEHAGFSTKECDYLYVDNSQGNQMDAYQAIRYFLLKARGRFLILCHQDIRLTNDKRVDLDRVLSELEALDPDWAVCGNAGGFTNLAQTYQRISDPHGTDQHLGKLPAQVLSLDENFLVIKRNACLSVSHALQGFHLYGTELCLLADRLGYRSYAVNFHLTHLSGGSPHSAAFERSRQQFIAQHQRALRARFIRTTCISLYLGSNRCLTQIFNTHFVLRIVKYCHKALQFWRTK